MTRFILPAALILLDFIGCQHSPKQPAPAPTASEIPIATPATGSVRLTYAKAQAAVQAWLGDAMQGGSVVVVKLKKIPRQRSAEARLRFTNLRYINEDFTHVSYTGKGSPFSPMTLTVAGSPPLSQRSMASTASFKTP